MVREFVAGWDVIETLGEGAYGEVLLLLNRNTGEAVAVKVLDLTKAKEVTDLAKKEVCIHRLLKHENVIRYYGHREEQRTHYIFVEYAMGGELFDKIPMEGMPQWQAQKYFTQIIDGVEYLHSVGVAHRDLKPENILLDANDNVKIADFGLATLFLYGGKERELNTRCGTLQYVAPDLFNKSYRAQPADVWSCGMILVAMLAAELPWDKPLAECENYVSWKKGDYSKSPWSKINTLALALLRKILTHKPEKRYTIPKIKQHLWFTKSHRHNGMEKWSRSIDLKKQCSEQLVLNNLESVTKIACSQPDGALRGRNCFMDLDSEGLDVLSHGISFSQPANPEHMILCSQMPSSANGSQTPVDKLVVKRITRFIVKLGADAAAKELMAALERLGYTWKKSSPGQVTVTTLDRRKMQLIFKATLIDIQSSILLDFRLSRGDGLEFKKHFLIIRESMADVIVKGPIIWPLTMAKASAKS